MKYYEISTFNRSDPELCRLIAEVEGLGLKSWKLSEGEPLAPGDYPEDAKIAMSDGQPQMLVGNIVPNTRNLLIVSQAVKEVIERINKGPTEYLPLVILNHRRRPASMAHAIIHPTGTWDVLDRSASEIEMFEGDVVGIDKMVFDPRRLADAPDLFRLRDQSHSYFISQRLLDAIRTVEPKVVVVEIPQSGETSP